MERWSMENFKVFSEIFYNLLVGTAAGVFVIFQAISKLIKIIGNFLYKRNIRKIYPREKLKKTYKIIYSNSSGGRLYLADQVKPTKYWIASAPTLLDLGFTWDDAERVDDAAFNAYPTGPRILTSGKEGE